MPTILVLIGAAIPVAVILFAFVWYIRTQNFKPAADKLLQQQKLNETVQDAGLAYERNGDYFYSLINCWQRRTGYCRLYDEGAPLFNMILDCEPIAFDYGNKRWLIELWKGQYGISTGAEIGIYNTVREDIQTEKFAGTFYENIADEEMMPLSFVLRKDKRILLRRTGVHWWLTGFQPGEFSEPDSLAMDAKITFPNPEMCRAFVDGLRRTGYTYKEFSVFRTTVTVHYTKPHTPQPRSRERLQKAAVQQINENNCKLFSTITADFTNTPDKLEYLQAATPELYHLLLHSLYSRAFYDSFKWLLELVFSPQPTLGPQPKPDTQEQADAGEPGETDHESLR